MSKFHEIAVRTDLAVCEGLLRCRHALSLPSESPGTPRVRFCRTVESTPTRSLKNCWLRVLTSNAAHGLLTGAVLLLITSVSTAQVFDPGPSDSSLFTTVINLPPDPNIGDGEGIGDSTQLNVATGGVVGDDFTVDSGGEVNISGGLVGQNLGALAGSEVNISGGTVGGSFEASRNSFVTISGGTVGPEFRAPFGSLVELVGGEFRLNGNDYAETSISLLSGDLFSGTLTDGSTFLFSHSEDDLLIGVTLTSATIPPLDTTPMVVNTDVSDGPAGLRRGQSLTLQTGGNLADNFAMVDATLTVEGGSVGMGVEAVSSVLNISGGSVGSFEVHSDSQVNISGGTVEDDSSARSAVAVTISGGNLRGHLFANGAGEVTISGGTVEGRIITGGDVHMTGGSIGGLSVSDNSVATIDGGVVTGTISASDTAQLNIQGGVFGGLRLDRNAEANISGGTITGFRSHQIRESTLNISGGSLGGFFDIRELSEVNISGGTLGRTVRTSRLSKLRLSGGTIGQDYRPGPFGGGDLELVGGEFRLNGVAVGEGELALTDGDILTGTLADGSTFAFSPGLNDSLSFSAVTLTSASVPDLDLTPIVIDTPVTEGSSGLRMGQSLSLQPGGELRNNFTVIGATLNVDGGIVGSDMEVVDGTVNLNSGSVGTDFSLLPGSIANIRGGNIADGIEVFAGSMVNLFGTEFLLNDLPLDTLSLGETITIADRNVSLTGRLADGSPFSFDLNTNPAFRGPWSPDYFDLDATLTVTLVPEPSAVWLLISGAIYLAARRHGTSA